MKWKHNFSIFSFPFLVSVGNISCRRGRKGLSLCFDRSIVFRQNCLVFALNRVCLTSYHFSSANTWSHNQSPFNNPPASRIKRSFSKHIINSCDFRSVSSMKSTSSRLLVFSARKPRKTAFYWVAKITTCQWILNYISSKVYCIIFFCTLRFYGNYFIQNTVTLQF
jgi:hypothetical protein